MASDVDICNRALQKLGAKRIVDLTDDSVNARACNACFDNLRDAELRAHPWSFAINRAQLAADATPPTFGRANAFQLPSTCLRLLPPYPEMNFNSRDWQIEGRKIYTDDAAPLEIRFIEQVTDPNQMDVLFREVLAARIALELCEELTQSNQKQAAIMQQYTLAIAEARRTNAIENVPQKAADDEWLTIRM